MRKVQELILDIETDSPFIASDIIAGWKSIPGFIYAYARCSTQASGDTPDQVVGLFEVTGTPKFNNSLRIAYLQEEPITETIDLTDWNDSSCEYNDWDASND